ncbi:transcriptional activator srcap [Fusarium agapanthi]|uniref:Transcriptional activator srcap n=1 Tax=Fusarium agapanthi TaxID=1803897 RepID=A0A9P5AWR9_9HYPO|nr:transcriptional activator srcap [Fusarium agapanthi]
MNECDSLLRQAREFLEAVKPKALEVGFGFGTDGGLGGIQRVAATLQVELSAGKTHFDDRISGHRKGLPSCEPWREILPDVSSNILNYIDLKILYGLQSLPKGIPTQIQITEISLGKARMELHGMLVCDDSDDTDPKDVPRVSLGLIGVRASIQWNNLEPLGLAITSCSFSLGVEVLLHAVEPKVVIGSTTPLVPATLIGDISYGDEASFLEAPPNAAMEMFQHFSMETLVARKGTHAPEAPNTQLLVLVASVHFSSISLTFIQWRDPAWPPSVSSKRITSYGGPDRAFPWSAHKVTEQLLAQALGNTSGDQLDDRIGQRSSAGVTKREFDALAIATVKPTDSLFFKANKDQGVSTAVLEYVFAHPKQPQKSLCRGPSLRTSGSNQAEESSNKALCPLTIENVGLQCDRDTNRLGIVLDVTFLLGPIGLALLGLSLSCKLQSSSLSLALRYPLQSTSLLDDAAAAEETSGLIVSFDKDPLTIAGGFMYATVSGADYYAGGLIFKFKPWMVMAAGVYGQVPHPNNTKTLSYRGSGMICVDSSGDKIWDESWDESSTDESCLIGDCLGAPHNGSFTMLFIIFKLESLLFSVGFADISGLTGGVGVNTDVRLP